MYDTSTVKWTLGSRAFFCSTRTNNSEHVKGIIPLSGPSDATGFVRGVTVRVYGAHTSHHTVQQAGQQTPRAYTQLGTYL